MVRPRPDERDRRAALDLLLAGSWCDRRMPVDLRGAFARWLETGEGSGIGDPIDEVLYLLAEAHLRGRLAAKTTVE